MQGPLPIIDEQRFVSEAETCPYLPQETASMEYRVIPQIDAIGYRELLRRGWRRFGCVFFRPACANCNKCRSLRIDVARFKPSKSQRRNRNRNADVRVIVQPPTISEDHIRLYNAYHDDMQLRRDWPANRTDLLQYYQSFLVGDFPFAREFLYYRDERLVGVGLVDEVADAISSVYFYHDPAWRRQGPGVFSTLSEIRHAAESELKHLYFGYWVADCQSMQYKANYSPHELLRSFTADAEEPRWD